MLGLLLTLTVVIDPGHGGSNTGAPGRQTGVFEKQVTLAIARALRQRLRDEGVQVVMTRERDTYLTLRERVRRANAAGAELFISLHTNASPEHGRRGIETYVLEREASDVEARRAAQAAADPVSGVLADLRLVEARRGAIALARAVQSRLTAARGAAGSDRGVKQAGYDVLAGVEAPAILVEVGFIDHPIEGAELLRADVQERTAQAIAEGIFDFVSHPVRLAKNSH
jgi:N-acetylmuramoyl-L-alanine amidase